MQIVLRLLRYLRPHWARLTLGLACSLLGVALELARPWPVKIVVDYVLGAHPRPAAVEHALAFLPGTGTARGLLLWSVIALGIVVLGVALLEMVARVVGFDVAQRMVTALSGDVFARLQRLSLSFHGRHQVGDLIQRVGADVFVVQSVVVSVALPILISGLTLVGMFWVMAGLDRVMALATFAVVPVVVLALALFQKPLMTTSTRQWQSQGALMAFLEQSLSSIKLVQGFAREPYIEEKMSAQTRELGNAYKHLLVVGMGFNQVTGAIVGTAGVLLLWLGGNRVMTGALSVGDLLVFLGYLAAIQGPITGVATAVATGAAVATRGKRVLEILDAQDELPEPAQAVTLRDVRGEVRFEDVTFGYAVAEDGASSRPVLREISFCVRPGETVAIVGATGAGKSSLVSLLSRFHDPNGGVIRIDGHDLRALSLRSLRENVSLVLQESFIFPMSVADNILFGRPDATRAEVVEAARVAHAHGFIERLPDGYDTIVGEKGSTLSGGERQRIAIARAVLKDAPILVLDEPTSALDAHTESLIFDALSRLVEGRTAFVISHRLSTIRRASQIIALEDGRIAEVGTHEELLGLGKVYAKLYQHQHIAAL